MSGDRHVFHGVVRKNIPSDIKCLHFAAACGILNSTPYLFTPKQRAWVHYEQEIIKNNDNCGGRAAYYGGGRGAFARYKRQARQNKRGKQRG